MKKHTLRTRTVLKWLFWIWLWRNPFYKWMTVYDAVAARYCQSVVKRDGAITEAALDILNERVLRLKANALRIDLVRAILLLALLLYSFGIVLKVNIQGAELQLNAQMREVLLLFAVTANLYSSFTSVLISALYACLKQGMLLTGISAAKRYKYLNQTDLFVEFMYDKANRSIPLFFGMLAISLIVLAHLVAFLTFDVGAYVYLALSVRSHPAFDGYSLLLSNYTLLMVGSVLVFSLSFNICKFRFQNLRYEQLRKNMSRYSLIFFKIAIRRRVAMGIITFEQ